MLVRVANEPLKTLAAETNETAHLAVREGKRALFIDHVTSSHVISISGQTGELVPLYCTSHGKALLSDFEERDLTRMSHRFFDDVKNCREFVFPQAAIRLRGWSGNLWVCRLMENLSRGKNDFRDHPIVDGRHGSRNALDEAFDLKWNFT
jgi:hypothetical protein